MRTKLSIPILIIAICLISGCSSSSTEGKSNPISSHSVPQNMAFIDDGGESVICTNPIRSSYDVVVMDYDRWELCMNLERERLQCNSYSGHLWYQSGPFIFEGPLTAVFNHSLDMLAVTALDSGWECGHILYSMQFTEVPNELYGSYVYYEFPNRTNGIGAFLVQGQLGEHVYGQQPSSYDPDMPKSKHAKVAAEED